VTFANGASEAVVISSDDPGALRVRAGITHPNVISFGFAEDADLRSPTSSPTARSPRR
jgi:UDP-N-acetylmuramate--alanine ligase